MYISHSLHHYSVRHLQILWKLPEMYIGHSLFRASQIGNHVSTLQSVYWKPCQHSSNLWHIQMLSGINSFLGSATRFYPKQSPCSIRFEHITLRLTSQIIDGGTKVFTNPLSFHLVTFIFSRNDRYFGLSGPQRKQATSYLQEYYGLLGETMNAIGNGFLEMPPGWFCGDERYWPSISRDASRLVLWSLSILLLLFFKLFV